MDFPRFMMLRAEKISMDPMAPMEVLTFDQNFRNNNSLFINSFGRS
jgi:hypothetical protein